MFEITCRVSSSLAASLAVRALVLNCSSPSTTFSPTSLSTSLSSSAFFCLLSSLTDCNSERKSPNWTGESLLRPALRTLCFSRFVARADQSSSLRPSSRSSHAWQHGGHQQQNEDHYEEK